MRKVIQLIVQPDAEYSIGTYSQGVFMALCDDGTIWSRDYRFDVDETSGEPCNRRYEWTQIPGPPAE